MDTAYIAVVISFMSLIVSMTGWFITHFLSLRTQTIALANSARNDARKDLLQGFHDYQNYLIEVDSSISHFSERLSKCESEGDRIRRLADFTGVLASNDSYLWLRNLEDYESLFPETADIRVKLLGLGRRFQERCENYQQAIFDGDVKQGSVLFEQCKDLLFDLVALVHDLAVHITNESFGRITGTRINARTPFGKSDARIEKGEDGQLKTVGRINDVEL